MVAEFILGTNLVLEGTSLVSVGDGGQRPGAEALLFQSQTVPILIRVHHLGDCRQAVFLQPAVHDGEIVIGMGLLTPGIGKQDQVHRDLPVV